MLIHLVSLQLYNKISQGSNQWMQENITLIARAALLIYRKCGREEAAMFIALIRVALLVEVG